ncbi:hypothetical protein SAMD00019534_083310 [Acytostelium subglobosum LB1]|uniref:hypothetical protein n=1 Tax=Acytostelium subglobosum LB1 TaxID=1410327 RepID=UPI000644DB43|nr:hypothetical protein SAMD00019534_083310 [Acytostelium subglobosum LB1]GAM25156.1 hypothetical protein SAMD00019534_083310 [Acytostelium subglobosum LB1]|eukprot:XP_012751676.1 hypothetical protein SAMD00019534_083310 [Acytostelium subglobosum LB1]
MASILVATKLNYSSPIELRIRDILNVGYYVLTNKKLLIDETYYTLKDNIIKMEQVLLRTLSFDVSLSSSVKVPHNYLLHFVHFLDDSIAHDKLPVIGQSALDLLNDCALTPLPLLIDNPSSLAFMCLSTAIDLYGKNNKDIIPITKDRLGQILGVVVVTSESNNNNEKVVFECLIDELYQWMNDCSPINFANDVHSTDAMLLQGVNTN